MSHGASRLQALISSPDPLPPALCLQSNSNSRLTAARSLRARKICAYISDRLHLAPPRSTPISLSPTPHGSHANLQSLSALAASSPLGGQTTAVAKPEDEIELMCNGMVLPVKMTLGAVRAFVYRGMGGGDVLIQYRWRRRE